MSDFGQDFIISCYKVVRRLNQQMKKKIKKKSVETSSIDGGEFWWKGFATGFASSTVSGTETFITNKFQCWKKKNRCTITIHSEIVEFLVKFDCYTLSGSPATKDLQELWSELALSFNGFFFSHFGFGFGFAVCDSAVSVSVSLRGYGSAYACATSSAFIIKKHLWRVSRTGFGSSWMLNARVA